MEKNNTKRKVTQVNIKRLAIQDIINNDNFTLDKNNIMNSDKTKKIPILLGIKMVQIGMEIRFWVADTANLCGYLLDYVFSQKRKGEEFVLLAMYVAVNIDNKCFDDYIQNKDENTCNTAFKNMARILGLTNHDDVADNIGNCRQIQSPH
jgi:hypothetical protein